MAVRRLQYSQELEKGLAKGENVEQAHESATKSSSVKNEKKKKQKPFAYLRRKAKELYYGKDMPISEKQKKLRRKFEIKLAAANYKKKRERVKKYRQLGGSKTKEGRAYRRKWMKKHGG